MRICAHMKLIRATESWAANTRITTARTLFPESSIARYVEKFKEHPEEWMIILSNHGFGSSDLIALNFEKTEMAVNRKVRAIERVLVARESVL